MSSGSVCLFISKKTLAPVVFTVASAALAVCVRHGTRGHAWADPIERRLPSGGVLLLRGNRCRCRRCRCRRCRCRCILVAASWCIEHGALACHATVVQSRRVLHMALLVRLAHSHHRKRLLVRQVTHLLQSQHARPHRVATSHTATPDISHLPLLVMLHEEHVDSMARAGQLHERARCACTCVHELGLHARHDGCHGRGRNGGQLQHVHAVLAAPCQQAAVVSGQVLEAVDHTRHYGHTTGKHHSDADPLCGLGPDELVGKRGKQGRNPICRLHDSVMVWICYAVPCASLWRQFF